MRVLSIDPGAKRMGWAVLDWDAGTPTFVDSGLISCVRADNEAFQEHRLRIVTHFAGAAAGHIDFYRPTQLINEIIPAVGGGNFAVAGVSYLANVALSIVQAIAVLKGLTITQIGATTVKQKIGGSKKASKVKVRNGVYEVFPFLKDHHKQWVKVFDEPDAIAVGLTGGGYDLR